MTTTLWHIKVKQLKKKDKSKILKRYKEKRYIIFESITIKLKLIS